MMGEKMNMWFVGKPSKGQMLIIKLFQRVLKIISLDSRSLAVFRIMIALTTITDAMTRFPDAHHHYSDAGMFPREFILRSFTNYYWITMHMLSGSVFVMQLLFLLEILFGFLLLVGYRTRTMTILSWIMVCSVQNRNYILGHSGDTVHRLYLFWGIFLPLSRHFSLDNVLASPPPARPHSQIEEEADDARDDKKRTPIAGATERCNIANFGTAAYLVQLFVMYYIAHHLKTSAEWREKGVAAWMALQLDYFRTWFGDLLLIWTPGVIFANFAVLKWQHYGSLMFFFPVKNEYFKAFACLGFLAMHCGFGMAFYLETFTWATISAVLGAVPGWVWDFGYKIVGNLAPFSKPIQIHVTPNSKRSANVAYCLQQFMLPGRCKVYYTSGNKELRHFGISVTDQQRNVHSGPEVFSVIAKSSPILYPLHYILRTRYGLLAVQYAAALFYSSPRNFPVDVEAGLESSKSYTSNFAVSDGSDFGVMVESGVNMGISNGKREFFEDQSNKFTMSDVKEASKIGFKAAKEAFVALLFILMISTNVGTFDHRFGVPPSLQPVLWAAQLDQYWGMFAPRPPDITWWYNFEGYLDDGTHVELFNDGAMHNFIPNIPHTWDKPNIHDSIGNHRWFKLFENGLNSHANKEDIRLYFGRWFCREFNARHSGKNRLHKYSIHFMYERLDMQKMDGSRFPPGRETIWNHMCYEK